VNRQLTKEGRVKGRLSNVKGGQELR